MDQKDFEKKKAYLQSLEDKEVRSYDYDDRNDCYVEGVMYAVYDAHVCIGVTKWVVNGVSAKNYTPTVVPRIDTARIVPLEQIRNMADAGMTAMLLEEEARELARDDQERRAKLGMPPI